MDYSINRGLIEILKTLDKRDKREFKKFLNSSFTNPFPKTISVYKALLCFAPDYNPELLNRKTLFIKLKSRKKYNDSTMRDLLSKLNSLANKYLAYANFNNDEYSRLQHQRNEYFSRKLLTQIDKNLIISEKSINNIPETETDYFLRKMMLKTAKFNYYVINKKIYNNQYLNESVDLLSSSAGYLLAMFILESIKMNDTIIKISKRHENLSNTNFIPGLFKTFNLEKAIIELGKSNKSLSHIFRIYYYLYMMFSNSNSGEYFRLYKETIIQNEIMINKDEMHFLFGRLIDYCVHKCNEGKIEYYEELFNANMVLLENRFFTNSTNKYLSEDLFRNVIYSAIRTKKLKWAELFVKNSTNDLHPKNREQLINYAYALIHFEKGDFNRSLKYLLNTNLEYITLKIDVKVLMLKIYFELGSFENIYSLIDSFKHFISNHEFIFSVRRKKLKDFINLYEILFKSAERNDRESIEILYKKLLQKEDLEYYSWLLSKAKNYCS